MTKEPWSKCWEMNIYEFFNYLVFAREVKRREMEARKKYMKGR